MGNFYRILTDFKNFLLFLFIPKVFYAIIII